LNKFKRLVIVGGNAAGMAAATSARRRRPDMDIIIVEKGRQVAMATCSIPAYLEHRIETIEALENITPAEASEKYRLVVMTEHEALEINPRNHNLTVKNTLTDQSFDIPYDRLIIATGARAVKPVWPNVHAQGIFALRYLEDALALRHFIERKKPRQVVIVGTGTIAQACAAGLRRYGLEVTMIGQKENQLMENLEDSIAARILSELESHDVSLHFDDNWSNVKVSLEGEVEAIETATGILTCQGVLLALGVKPNIDLAQTADLALGIQGTIRIDKHMMTSRQEIFACGDCTHTFWNLTHKPIYWPLATTASRQGRQVGECACGLHGEDPGTLATRLWTCFDLKIGRVGLSSSQTSEMGIKSVTTVLEAPSKPGLYGGHRLSLVVISSAVDGRILGGQIAGCEGVHARLNTLTTAIAGRLTLKDLENLDLGYSPEVSSLWDPIQTAGRLGRRH
jgi:NADPH-dependent 2,4-dienoyl-CoA reductase/sulfur reductase-like enzyme